MDGAQELPPALRCNPGLIFQAMRQYVKHSPGGAGEAFITYRRAKYDSVSLPLREIKASGWAECYKRDIHVISPLSDVR